MKNTLLLLLLPFIVTSQSIDPIIHYPFNGSLEDVAGLTQADIEGDYSFENGIVDGAIHLSGEGSMVVLNNSESLELADQDYTIAMVVKFPESQPEDDSWTNTFLSKWMHADGQIYSDGFPFSLHLNNQTHPLDYERGRFLLAYLTGGIDIGAPGQWVHLTIQKSGDNIFVYQNGIRSYEVDLDNTTEKLEDNDAPIILGAGAQNATKTTVNSTRISIDDFRLYDVALSQNQIKELISLTTNTDDPYLVHDCSENLNIDLVNQQLSWNYDAPVSTRIVDLNGHIVYQKTAKSIAVQSLPKGIYFISNDLCDKSYRWIKL